MNKEEILLELRGILLLTLPLTYSSFFLNPDNVRFLGPNNEQWEIKYEPQKGATTILQMYVNGSHIRGFENAEQVVSYFYAKESAK